MKTAALIAGLFAAAANALVPVEKGTKTIPHQFVVAFKEGVQTQAHLEHVKGLIAADKFGEILHEYEIGSFKGYAVRCSEKVLNKIREADGVVRAIAQDGLASIDANQANPPSWGLDRIDQLDLPLDQSFSYPDSAGQGVNMYTIDTGIWITHNDFGGRATWGYTAPSAGGNQDLNGHGTHCSGTMAGTSYGIAKKANLIAVKVLSDGGSGPWSDVIGGVNWVASQHSAGDKSVANMSLGGGSYPLLDDAVNAAVDAGVHMIVAAGNSNANACNYSPARAEKAVCVGATDSSDRKATYSNYGTCVEIHAPGSAITSAWTGSNTATNTISGTSMATPHVAGVAAVYLAEGIVPSIANLQAASTKDAISGLPAGTVNYLLYVDDQILSQEGRIYW